MRLIMLFCAAIALSLISPPSFLSIDTAGVAYAKGNKADHGGQGKEEVQKKTKKVEEKDRIREQERDREHQLNQLREERQRRLNKAQEEYDRDVERAQKEENVEKREKILERARRKLGDKTDSINKKYNEKSSRMNN